MPAVRELHSSINLHQCSFVCTETFEVADISELWQSIDSGLMPSLWQCEDSFLAIQGETLTLSEELPAALLIKPEGTDYNLEGIVRAEPQPLGITWYGDFSHEKEGWITFKLALSFRHQQSPTTKSKPEQPEQNDIPEIYDIELSLEILTCKGRIALLDPRKTAPYWQDSLSLLCDNIHTHIEKKIQQKIHNDQILEKRHQRRARKQRKTHFAKRKQRWLVFFILATIIAIFLFA